MCYLNAMHLEVYPLEAMVKIGDTISDIEAGLNAGMWTIGLTQSGNELGLSEEEVSGLTAEEMQAKTDPIEHRYRNAGTHYVAAGQAKTDPIEHRYRNAGTHYVAAGIWEVQPLIDDINARLAHGATP
jgi:phosphonoacetaldehyde hydrolase